MTISLLTPDSAPVEELEAFINNINSVLESLYIEIKKGVTEDDGRPIYALVNLATTPISKMASDFAENELDLFRKAVSTIKSHRPSFLMGYFVFIFSLGGLSLQLE